MLLEKEILRQILLYKIKFENKAAETTRQKCSVFIEDHWLKNEALRSGSAKFR